jgi:cobalt-zinc-cadmium resistance protein CzcA
MSDHPSQPARVTSLMNALVASSLRQSMLVLFLTLLLIGAGTRSLDRLPVDAYPDLSPPRVQIITQWPGHAAEEVERLITVPIEVGMNGLPRMTTVRSISLYGLSVVTYAFDGGTDRYFARQEAFNRIGDLSLPSGVTPSVSRLTSPSGLIYRYVLQSSDRSPMELKTFEDWVVEPQYKSVSGVADDSGFGGGTMQYQVLLDPAKIAGLGLTVSGIESALSANNSNAGGGFYSQGGQFYYVRGLGRIVTPEDIGNIVLAVHNGTPVLVKDVGRVEIGIAPRLGEFGFNKQDDAVEGVILLRT